ncbi:S1 family peptidase [Brucella pituitosa]|uniref:S1 family peptidase n=1 Tax=Brucella pituitosa TaxID=571256 RepID=UPI0012FD3109|nr:serine protease [Brucella pituitosa]
MNVEMQLAHLTVRLLVTREDGGTHSGTGFFIGFDQGGKGSKVYCVTNRHVLEGAVKCHIPVTRDDGNGVPCYGQVADVAVDDIAQTVLFHPDDAVDLAAFPFHGIMNQLQSQGFAPFIKAINRNELPQDAFFSNIDLASDVVMIGYPNGLWDEANNMPILRRGITATPPSLDFNGKKQFAIDCACFPGSSGSPIFLFQRNGYTDENGNHFINGNRILLIGILFAGPQFTVGGQIVPKSIPTSLSVEVRSMIMMHLGYCIKSTELAWLDSVVAANS